MIVLLLNLESKGNSLEMWRNFQRLKKKYEQVKEENNFLKLKYELLMEVVRTFGFWSFGLSLKNQSITLLWEKRNIFGMCIW